MLRKDEFATRAKAIHGEKYDYSMVEYLGYNKKVCIICPEHGVFWQTPHNHIAGSKCPECAKVSRSQKRKKEQNEVITDFRKKHGERYDYSEVSYVDSQTKVCIICPIHGKFWQTPTSHLSGQGCPKCGGRFMNREYFIERATAIHNNKYNYDLVEYHGIHSKVCIICPIHGKFWQTPHHHLVGFGCKRCSNNFLDKECFIEKAREIHGDKYDYSDVEYINNHTKVCIKCPEHGPFWQIPNSHLNGRGCKECGESHMERKIKKFLIDNKIEYIYQYRDKEILNRQSIDFYLPKYKIAIECQGEQHFVSNFYKSKGIEYSQEHLRYIQSLDERKKRICKENDIFLIYFLEKRFNKFLSSDDVFINKEDEILRFIKTGKKSL